MALLDFFLYNKKQTANIAKQRLQIIIAEHRKNNQEPDYFPTLKNEILLILSKYVNVNPNMIQINLEYNKKNISILELNITIPE
ncbi:Cell division topological specificity factor [Buchnera aphidicola (Eriosoma grossulariae)]|uniref:cell division topological specificity factor MinE n=1 Tax=Buchnera aphidicola TaxID=9 RepID=UPI003463854D